MLTEQHGDSWLVEGASPNLFFRGESAPGALLTTTPSVVRAYLEHDGGGATSACVTNVEAIATSATRVGRACGPGKLARGSQENACSEGVDSQALAPETLRCGALDDLALALSGLSPSSTWVTRAEGIVLAHRFGDDVSISLVHGLPASPFVEAESDDSRCVPCPRWGDAPGPHGIDTGPAHGKPSRCRAISALREPRARGEPCRRSRVRRCRPPSIHEGPRVTSHSSFSCGCSPAEHGGTRSDDSCGSSDPGDESDDGCDSSGSGSEGDSSDEGCGSDGESASNGDDGCDGGSNDEGSDSCQSDEGSSSHDQCSMRRRSRRRSPASRAILILGAVLLPLRRLTRPRKEGRPLHVAK